MSGSDMKVIESKSDKGGPSLYYFLNWWLYIWRAAGTILTRLLRFQAAIIFFRKKISKKLVDSNSQTKESPPISIEEKSSDQSDVNCNILYSPENSDIDIIFIHGLYGSLANTWKQGLWKSKYNKDPEILLLRGTSNIEEYSEQNAQKTKTILNDLCDKCTCDMKDIIIETNEKYYTSRASTESNFNAETHSLNEFLKDICGDNDSFDIDIKSAVDEKMFDSKIAIFDEFDHINAKTNVNVKDFNNTISQNVISNDELINQRNSCQNIGKSSKNSFIKRSYNINLDIIENNSNRILKGLNDTNPVTKNILRDKNSNNVCDKSFKGTYNNTFTSNTVITDKEVGKLNIFNDINTETVKKSDNSEDFSTNIEQMNCKKLEKNKKDFSCEINEQINDKTCAVGCGCICKECYSGCWPRDWVSKDVPNARVISISYSKNPYLWRPVWIWGQKRANMEARAEIMLRQLIELGVGEKPIIWVGHSKGGLFSKHIYSRAYDCYLNLEEKMCQNNLSQNCCKSSKQSQKPIQKLSQSNSHQFFLNTCQLNTNSSQPYPNTYGAQFESIDPQTQANSSDFQADLSHFRTQAVSNHPLQETCLCSKAANIWSQSKGFMFYSVPHRGSTLADIKIPPLVFRSQDLLDISKDSTSVLTLHERWLKAANASENLPKVHSLVETSKTLMGVLYLQIVGTESADANIGALCGVTVIDHREICKPSSRKCLLYTQLINLIKNCK